MLRDSLPYARLWQALAMLGDLAHDRKAYTEATRYYQEAFELSQDAQNTPIPPAMQVTQVLFKKAETSRLLADEYVPMARTQPHLVQTAGYTGGTRSFVPQRQAIPITFVFDSTQFDRKGQQAAQDLLRLLQDRQPPAITLIGHTDPQGSDAYNLRLSEQRAEAVKAFLAQGYHGRIRTEGHGERELYQPDDPQKYTEDELYRLYRRVELRFE
jgi:outer membrane protein OmpA-like peptidoglycan-associated protein